MEKTWLYKLFRVFRGLYDPVMWGIYKLALEACESPAFPLNVEDLPEIGGCSGDLCRDHKTINDNGN